MIYEEILQLNKDVRERFEKLERRIRKNEVISGFYEGINYSIVTDDDYTILQPYAIVRDFSPDVEQDYFRVVDPDAVKFNKERLAYQKHVKSSMEKVKGCCQWFDVEYYRLQGVKDVTLTFACNNKFCDACQSAISQKRYEKFAPVIDALQKTYDVAHVVFTVPNCKPKGLKAVLDRMYETRKYMMRYLSGTKKIRGIDLEKYGFEGAVISLEVSRNVEDGTYHPHFHCAMVFRKNSGVFARRKFINSYSFDKENKGEVRLFNDFEILLQAIWRLRYDGVEVNRHNIAGLKEGYSVIVERRDNFHEVFKYATKGVLKYDKDVQLVLGHYRDFVFLDFALFKRRLIQSYGILRGIPLLETVDQSAEGDKMYEEIIAQLKSIEDPIKQRELLESLLEEKESDKGMKYISRKNVKCLIGGDDADE